MVQPVSQKTLQKSPKVWLMQESPNLHPARHAGVAGECGRIVRLAAQLPGFVEGGDLGDAATGCRQAGEVASERRSGEKHRLFGSAAAASRMEASVAPTAHLRLADGEIAMLAVLDKAATSPKSKNNQVAEAEASAFLLPRLQAAVLPRPRADAVLSVTGS